jgi:hypothetical protein
MLSKLQAMTDSQSKFIKDLNETLSMSAKYPKYYKDVSHLQEVDVYMVHKLFNIQDPSGALQHASKKLLLSGVRTGGKSFYEDVREARDTLNRWLEIHKSYAELAR